MTWVKLDDQFADHPKIVQAGPAASWLYICGLTYAARLRTDGFIPEAQVRRLADVDEPERCAAVLVEVGLWERTEGGYRIHDYAEYQLTRADIERKREAGKAGGQARAKATAKAPAKARASKVPKLSHKDPVKNQEEKDRAPKPALTHASAVDQIFETIHQEWLKRPYDGSLSDDERGRINNAARQLRKLADATPAEISKRWAEAEARAGPGYPVTPQTLTKSWSDLAKSRADAQNGHAPASGYPRGAPNEKDRLVHVDRSKSNDRTALAKLRAEIDAAGGGNDQP